MEVLKKERTKAGLETRTVGLKDLEKRTESKKDLDKGIVLGKEKLLYKKRWRAAMNAAPNVDAQLLPKQSPQQQNQVTQPVMVATKTTTRKHEDKATTATENTFKVRGLDSIKICIYYKG